MKWEKSTTFSPSFVFFPRVRSEASQKKVGSISYFSFPRLPFLSLCNGSDFSLQNTLIFLDILDSDLLDEEKGEVKSELVHNKIFE